MTEEDSAYIGDYPKAWLQLEIDDPMQWSHHLSVIDQAWAATLDNLDIVIDNLIADIKDRPESKKHADAVCFSAITKGLMHRLESAGYNITWELLGVYNAAIYRLARLKLAEQERDSNG